MSGKKKDEALKKGEATEKNILPSQVYKCEGLIKEVTIQGDKKVTFKLEPVAPYVFEKKNDDGSTERCLLFVGDDKNRSAAKIITAGYEFVAPKPADFHSLIIAKASRFKVKVEAEFVIKSKLKKVNQIAFC